MRIYAVLIALLFDISYNIRASDKKFNVKRKSLAILKKQDSTVISLNPLYQDRENLGLITDVVHVYSVNQNFATKSDFYEYRKSQQNMTHRITYSDQGKTATHTWEKNPLYEN